VGSDDEVLACEPTQASLQIHMRLELTSSRAAAGSKPGGAGRCFGMAPRSSNSSRHFLKSAMCAMCCEAHVALVLCNRRGARLICCNRLET